MEVGGQVYEAPFVELSDWINEGSLLPGDKVRRGNLRWVEARLVPGLVPFFNAKAQGLPMPVVMSAVDTPLGDATPSEGSHASEPLTTPVIAVDSFPPVNAFVSTPDPIEHSLAFSAEPQTPRHDPDLCAIHNDVSSVYLCDGCGMGFCKVCPKSYGGSVRTCPFCGALCRAVSEIKQKEAATTKYNSAISRGFGAEDFFKALAHPFNFTVSLVFGALMFMALTLGQSVSALGGIYMMVSALFCALLANMLTFGILANTIQNFAHGRLDANFMPSFEDFELWDDVIHPFFLSIAAYVSSFGPLLAVVLIGFYFVVSSMTAEMDNFQQRVEKIPGTHYYDAKRTVDQSQDVQSVLGELDRSQSERLDELEETAAGTYEDAEEPESGLIETEDGRKVDRETLEQEELWAMAQESRKQSFEGAIGKSPETEAKENAAMLQGFLNLAAPIVVIGGIFFLWGVFYFPAACAVAGYTRSFMATINPVVGLDTIKRMGGTYFSLLFMGIVLMIASMIVGGLAGAILSPLDLPGFGNLPAKAIGALIGFYLWVVFSCLLGYAIYKKSDKLAIES